MHVIAGLGNPGREYRDTRHNAGFRAVDEIASLTRIKVIGFKYKGRTGSGRFKGGPLFLLKPRTYMNLSGLSVRACLNGLKATPESLIVIHDDLDLPPGRIRIKHGGGPGGHKGIASIIETLGTDEFVRVKIGIGRPDHIDPADYVLLPLEPEELEPFHDSVKRAAQAALAVLAEGVNTAMNKFNSKA
ncbi:MAG TPA: aminoacyl-tRNA hydrolase [bacterium]|nr:aminoacyl-tRNA hydrolase [bacterium]